MAKVKYSLWVKDKAVIKSKKNSPCGKTANSCWWGLGWGGNDACDDACDDVVSAEEALDWNSKSPSSNIIQIPPSTSIMLQYTQCTYAHIHTLSNNIIISPL